MSYLEQRFKEFNIDLDTNATLQFTKYKNLLQEYNKVMNLTAVDDDEGIVDRHFLDCIIPLRYIKTVKIDSKSSMVDVGSGAGFPGFPISILTHGKLVAIDALNKRINFLNTVIEELEIDNIKAIHARAEDVGRMKSYRDKFDISLSRAISHLSILVEFSIPLLKVGGKMIVLKSENIENELKESSNTLKILGAKIIENVVYDDALGIKRRVLVIEKYKKTSEKYPRKFSEIKKNRL